jgi:hypothetical protein
MAMKMQVEVFRVVKPRSAAVGYQRVEGLCCLYLQGEVNGAGKKVVDVGMEYKREVESHSQLRVGGGPEKG